MSSLFFSRLKAALAGGAAFGALASGAIAAPTAYLTPHIATDAGAVSVTVGGETFVNKGLQGVARLPATSTVDFNGDTFGAFSSLDVLPGTWRKTATGYTGTLFSLPDRGPNGIGSVTFSDFAGRTSSFAMDFTPYTGTTNLPATPSSNHQLQLTQTGGFFFKDFNGNVTTGLDPGLPGPTSFVTEDGIQLPGSTVGPAAGKISLDAEGLRFFSDGSFYVSDEYGANVYYFDKTGNMQGVIQPPPALIPRDGTGQLSFTSQADAVTGRRFNQGIEGVDITPDSKHLVTLLQSATMQDSTTAQQTRTNTRLMIYDISQSRTPTTPVADYVVQLPVYQANGDGTAANRTAAQSEILALNDTQFLVLSRDADGLGLANAPFVYKSILLIDTKGATNIAGTPYETSTTPIATGGVLNSSITSVAQTEVVNILNSTQLGKFGINLNNAAPTQMTLTEKWEGMALVPALDEAAPQDFFLLVGNDDDFLSTNCNVNGQNCAQSVNSDALVLVYRLTLPTYVDSGYLESMESSGPTTMAMTLEASRDLAASYDVGQHLEALRHGGYAPGTDWHGLDASLWAAGSWSRRGESSRTTDAETQGMTFGADVGLGDNALVGAALGYYWGDAKASGAYAESYGALQVSAYGAVDFGGLYGNLTGTYSRQNFNDILRAAAYGLVGAGNTSGNGAAITGEAGYLLEADGLRFGPLAGFRYIHAQVDGYTESGASGGNIVYPDISSSGVGGFFGGEASMGFEGFRSILRVTYNTRDASGDKNAVLRLASADDVMGTQTLLVPGLGQNHIAPSLMVQGTGPASWWLSYGANIGMDAGVEHHLSAGVKVHL